MTILARDAIFSEIKKGNIRISPFNENQVGPGSVDLHLDKTFRVFKRVHEVVHIDDKSDHTQYTEVIKVKDYLLLMPGESVQGVTVENITLTSNLCAWLEGRSRFARMGLLVHISAGFIQPGVSNKQVLEIKNLSHMPLALHPGTAICQMIFERTEGNGKFKGRYSKQKSV
jgi:dCTP deaminase